jgi:CheY-like chemotaxis protein
MEYLQANRPGTSMKAVTHAARRHILVVDDDDAIRSTIRLVLEFLGVKVTVAASGEAALEKMGTESFDLVLLDFNMPGMGGQQALAQMQNSHARTQVLMMSADAAWHPRETARRGACGFLRKPLRISDVLQAVEKALVVRGAREEEKNSV